MTRSSGHPALHLAHSLKATLSAGYACAGTDQRTAFARAARLAGLCLTAEPGSGWPAHAGPLERWKAGHRLFFALNQLTVVALRQARADGCRRAGAEAAAHALRAGAAAMTLTATFDQAAYHRTVRPAMMPPNLPVEGFSGLWSADHRALVTELGLWGNHHALSCRADCPARRTLLDALDETAAAHHGVCARFVGRRPSLLGGDDSLLVLDRLHQARHCSAAGSRPPRPPA
ncbi:hypothetical protein [Kitasatospora sp. CMC57]|uniref:hypothetical protein n=1 Tax=Kitasatospora sp. CMC57 TaxID=3231513 RepID=UPI0038B550B5